MKPYIIALRDSDLCNDEVQGGQLEGAEFEGEIQFTNNRQVVGAPTKPGQPIANQGMSCPIKLNFMQSLT